MTNLTLILLFFLMISDSARDGNKAYQEGKFAEAEQLYKDAIRENPEDPRLLFNLGSSLAQQEKFEEALAVFEQ